MLAELNSGISNPKLLGGGGGRVDFAQAGGDKKIHINQAFLAIKNQI